MKWNDFFNKCKEQLTLSEKELNELYQKTYNESKLMGVEDTELEEFTVSRLNAFLRKQFSTPAKKYNGVIIGATKTTDFGAQKAYDNAINIFKTNPEQAISSGIVDDMGTPIYTTPEWKRGQKIDPKGSRNRTLLLIAKKSDEQNYIKATLNLRAERIDKLNIPFFCEVEFRANPSDKSTPELLLLNDSVVTEFNIIRKLKINEVDKIVNVYYKDNLCSLKNLEKYHTANENNQNRFAIVEGDISRINITGDNVKSNIFELVDPTLDFNLEGLNDSVTCWLNKKDFEINFEESAVGVYVVGKTNRDKVNLTKVSLDVYGIFVDDLFMQKVKPEPIKEELIEEVDEEKTEKW